MANRLTGTYLTHRDGGILYRYEAMWTMSAGKIFWDSKVHRDNTLVGTPGGMIPTTPADVEPDHLVRLNVQDMIEAQFSGI